MSNKYTPRRPRAPKEIHPGPPPPPRRRRPLTPEQVARGERWTSALRLVASTYIELVDLPADLHEHRPTLATVAMTNLTEWMRDPPVPVSTAGAWVVPAVELVVVVGWGWASLSREILVTHRPEIRNIARLVFKADGPVDLVAAFRRRGIHLQGEPQPPPRRNRWRRR